MRRRSSAAPPYDTAPALSVVACTLGVVTLSLLVARIAGRPVSGSLALHAGVFAVLAVIVRVASRLARRRIISSVRSREPAP